MFDNLISRHPDGKLHPSLATEWKLQGQTTWVFKLRSGVKFHNGDPLTSADVKYSLERSWDPALKTRVNTVFTTIDRVEAPDPGTVVIHTKKPDPLLPARLAFYGGQILPEKYAKAAGPEAFNLKPVGSGPVALRVVDQGRQGRAGGQPRLLGRQDRRRSRDLPADPRDGAAGRRACSRARST